MAANPLVWEALTRNNGEEDRLPTMKAVVLPNQPAVVAFMFGDDSTFIFSLEKELFTILN